MPSLEQKAGRKLVLDGREINKFAKKRNYSRGRPQSPEFRLEEHIVKHITDFLRPKQQLTLEDESDEIHAKFCPDLHPMHIHLARSLVALSDRARTGFVHRPCITLILFDVVPSSTFWVFLTGHHLEQVFDTLLVEVRLCARVENVSIFRVT